MPRARTGRRRTFPLGICELSWVGSRVMSPLQTTGTLVCSAAFALAGCMPGGYVPPTPTAEAKTCPDLSGPVVSYAQDWGHDQLLDLETSMRDGVVIVRYDCEQIQVLRDCRLAGAYRYMALETRM